MQAAQEAHLFGPWQLTDGQTQSCGTGGRLSERQGQIKCRTFLHGRTKVSIGPKKKEKKKSQHKDDKMEEHIYGLTPVFSLFSQ